MDVLVEYGDIQTIECWIASGRDMLVRGATLKAAKDGGYDNIANLLVLFLEKKEETRHEVRIAHRWYDIRAAQIFAIVVFVSDALLGIGEGATATTPASRFFRIALRLPLELQMLLCNKAAGSGNETIYGRDSEVAFKELAKGVLMQEWFA